MKNVIDTAKGESFLEGKIEGKVEGKFETIGKMLEKGFNWSDITDITGISKADYLKIQTRNQE